MLGISGVEGSGGDLGYIDFSFLDILFILRLLFIISVKEMQIELYLGGR